MDNFNKEILMSKKELSNKITVISIIMAYLVVQLHAYNITVYSLDGESGNRFVVILENFVDKVCKLAVPMFFLISGYLFFRDYELKDTIRKWKTRLKTIVLPWILWGILYWIYFLVINNIMGENFVDNVSFSLKSFFDNVIAHENTIFWYMQTTVFFVMLAPLIYVVVRNTKSFPVGSITIIIVLFLCTVGVIPDQIRCFGDDIINYLPSKNYNIGYFMMGAYIGVNYKEIIKKKNKNLAIFCCIGLAVCIILLQFVHQIGFMNMISCIFLWYALDLFKFDKELPWYMHISFFVYCAHIAILNVIERVIVIFAGKNSVIWALLDFIFAPMLTFVIVFFIAYVMRRFTPRIWSVLNGGRG